MLLQLDNYKYMREKSENKRNPCGLAPGTLKPHQISRKSTKYTQRRRISTPTSRENDLMLDIDRRKELQPRPLFRQALLLSFVFFGAHCCVRRATSRARRAGNVGRSAGKRWCHVAGQGCQHRALPYRVL